MIERKRFTIGVLASGILDEFTKCVCEGVLQKAKNMDVNVVIFPGKFLYRDLSDNRELMFEYQYNTVFSYAKKENVDALIVNAGTIGCFTSEKNIRKMLESYADIPCVLVASKMEGYPSVVFDNYQGIKEGLEYLIENIGCRRFGMIGGNVENADAKERKQTFINVLAEHNIPFEDKMYVEGDLSRRCKKEIRKLLDDNPRLEAIFCVNDETAMGLYEELRIRGIQPGRDISVFGYDDTIVAAKASPSLSSVRADSSKLGAKAVEMAVSMIRGKEVKTKVMPTRFVKRDSIFRTKDEDDLKLRTDKTLESSFEEIYYRFLHEDMKEEMARLRGCYDRLNRTLLDNFLNPNAGLDEYVDIVLSIDDFLEAGGVKYADMDNLLTNFEKTYRELKKCQPDDKRRFELRDAFTIFYRKIIRSMNGQMGVMRSDEYDTYYAMKLFAQDILQFDKGRDQSYSSLLNNLDWLQIKNAGIYILSEPALHLYRENFKAPEEMQLKAVLQNGVVSTVPLLEQRMKSSDFFGNKYMKAKERFDRVALPLFYNENVYGILLCDMSDSLYNNGEFLVNQMSSAIKMIVLLQSNEQIQQQLEENLAALRDHNIELDNLSKLDLLTGILNRRGFFAAAEKRIAIAREKELTTVIGYVDMNNLKIINDRYGHDEGDFALKLIGQILKEIVGEQGIAGRIGGDEYAYIVEYDRMPVNGDMIQSIYQKFEQFNKESDKLYNVTVSAGVCVLQPDDTLTLDQALMQADAKLYEEKKKRKKEVAKKK